jgi:nucleoside-diphosphate-sugar epimerase
VPAPDPTPPHRILVAGATGVLGRRIVPTLLALGHEVAILARDPARAAPLAALGATVLEADVLDRAATLAAVTAARPGIVQHQLTDLAGLDVEANARIREAGTRNLVDGAQAAGAARIVVQSITMAYGPGEGPATEGDALDTAAAEPARRRSAEAVAAMEAMAAELPAHVILRFGMLYGPGTWFARDGRSAQDARAGRLHATPDVASFVHVDDAAAAAVAALDWPSGPVNVVDDAPVAGTVWVPAFAAAVGAPPPAAPAAGAVRDPRARGASNAEARRRGWRPRHPTHTEGFATL